MSAPAADAAADAPKDCPLCPRLVAYRAENARKEPFWFNGAVPSFGDPQGRLMIVGLAPGVRGANRTGRPFTGDFAGDLLYETIADFGFSEGAYAARPDDGLRLIDALLTNAVRCVPPENKPTSTEITACRPFLKATLQGAASLRAVLCLGRIAHESVLRALDAKLKAHPFQHAARHRVGDLSVFDSYHCSRYNTQTKRLTREMFRDVFAAIRAELDAAPNRKETAS